MVTKLFRLQNIYGTKKKIYEFQKNWNAHKIYEYLTNKQLCINDLLDYNLFFFYNAYKIEHLI